MRAKIYLHSFKESNYSLGKELGLEGEALDNFRYACYEVEIEVEVDPRTGDATPVKCDGRNIEP